jgi:mannose-6-phosphate isomerase-like protein (cupin superfamily)
MTGAVFITGFGIAWMTLPRTGDAADPPPKAIKSHVMSLADAAKNKAGWGEMRPYFTGHTPGTEAVFTATGTILPGKSIHGSHRHVEEEYLLITEGSGTWYLDGKEFPAKAGDMLFVESWVFHGIRNTSDKPLSFFVIKYNPKGVKLPQRPDNRPDELDPINEAR